MKFVSIQYRMLMQETFKAGCFCAQTFFCAKVCRVMMHGAIKSDEYPNFGKLSKKQVFNIHKNIM